MCINNNFYTEKLLYVIFLSADPSYVYHLTFSLYKQGLYRIGELDKKVNE